MATPSLSLNLITSLWRIILSMWGISHMDSLSCWVVINIFGTQTSRGERCSYYDMFQVHSWIKTQWLIWVWQSWHSWSVQREMGRLRQVPALTDSQPIFCSCRVCLVCSLGISSWTQTWLLSLNKIEITDKLAFCYSGGTPMHKQIKCTDGNDVIARSLLPYIGQNIRWWVYAKRSCVSPFNWKLISYFLFLPQGTMRQFLKSTTTWEVSRLRWTANRSTVPMQRGTKRVMRQSWQSVLQSP